MSVDLHNLSGPAILWRRMTSGVPIRWEYTKNFAVRDLMLT